MSTTSTTTAARILTCAPQILRRWEALVRSEVRASREQPVSVLRNNLPHLLSEVSSALGEAPEAGIRIAGLTVSEDHGGQRALLEAYSLADVFLEYRLLRRTILEILDESEPLSTRERELITDALELAMQHAGSHYALVQQKAERQRGDAATDLAAELQAAYDRERRITRALQRPLLQKSAEDAVAGLSLATFYEPALREAEVGGDFFDVIVLPEGRVALVVGDACGKGIEAAAHNTHVKDVLRAFLGEDPVHPGSVLSRLNFAVYAALQGGDPAALETFIVLLVAVLTPGTGEVLCTSAGAEPLLVVRAGGRTESVENPALPLGILPEAHYEDRPLHLGPGDTLLLTTDGVTEARRGGILLGYEGMTRLARESLRGSSLENAGQAILAGARAFAGGILSDDACLILARRR